jgi:hypothetical protein
MQRSGIRGFAAAAKRPEGSFHHEGAKATKVFRAMRKKQI